MQKSVENFICNALVIVLALVLPIFLFFPVLGFYQCTISSCLIFTSIYLIEGKFLAAFFYLIQVLAWYFLITNVLNALISKRPKKFGLSSTCLLISTAILALLFSPIHGNGSSGVNFFQDLLASIIN